MPAFASDDDYRRARDILRNANYSVDGINELLGLNSQKVPDKLPAWLQRTSELISPSAT